MSKSYKLNKLNNFHKIENMKADNIRIIWGVFKWLLLVVLKAGYYVTKGVSKPIEDRWNKRFGVSLPVHGNIVVVDTLGGSGKTSFAEHVDKNSNGSNQYSHIRLDNCKFGPGWKRYSSKEFLDNVAAEESHCETYNKYWVVDSIYSDPKCIMLATVMRRYMDNADIVMWHDYPFWVIIWRKLFRSYKRAIGVAPQGASVETFWNVVEMTKKTINTFTECRKKLQNGWNNEKGYIKDNGVGKYYKLNWPYFYYPSVNIDE